MSGFFSSTSFFASRANERIWRLSEQPFFLSLWAGGYRPSCPLVVVVMTLSLACTYASTHLHLHLHICHRHVHNGNLSIYGMTCICRWLFAVDRIYTHKTQYLVHRQAWSGELAALIWVMQLEFGAIYGSHFFTSRCS